MTTETKASQPTKASRPFVFLDRDGTIIENRHYLADPDGVALCPGAAEGLRSLQDAGFRLAVISNQSGVGRGLFTESQLHAVNDRMLALLLAHGVNIEAVYWCPHAPEEDCDCRKPRTGMVTRALRELGGDLRGACVIGDSEVDMNLARTLGIPGVLVRTGHGRATETLATPLHHFAADDLAAAARMILERSSIAE